MGFIFNHIPLRVLAQSNIFL